MTEVQKLGEYEILREVGRGGMGVVYEALDTRLGGRRVALKVILNTSRGRHSSERFRREANSAARLVNPGIVQVFNFGEVEGKPFIAMEFVDGTPFDELLKRHAPVRTRPPPDEPDEFDPASTERLSRPPSPRDADDRANDDASRRARLRRFVKILSAAARALHFAHENGVLHRDVKPANMLVGAGDVVKLADFGLARLEASGDTLTASGEIIGTLAYMAPEQIAGAKTPLSRRTDIYSLGVGLFEILAGRRPFDDPSAHTLMRKIQEDDPPRPHKLAADVPCDLEVICLKAMEKDPERRYPTAAELADDLDHWLNDEPILARPAGPLTRAVKFVRRRRIPIAFAVLTATGAVAVHLYLGERRRTNVVEARTILEQSLMRSLAGPNLEVLKLLDHAHDLDPDNVDVLLQRGLVRLNMDDPARAIADFDAGLKVKPGEPALSFAKATTLKFTGVETVFPELAPEKIDDHIRLTALGFAMIHDGRAYASIAAFDRAKAIDPTWPQSYFGLAAANFLLRRHEECLRNLDTFVTLVPNHVVGRCLGAFSASRLARVAHGGRRAELLGQAARYLAPLEAAKGVAIVAAARAALELTKSGSTDSRATAAAFDPVDPLLGATAGPTQLSNAVVFELLAVTVVDGDPPRGRRYAESALAIRRGTERATFALGRAHELEGRVAAAADVYRGLLKRFGNSMGAAPALCRLYLEQQGLVSDDEAESAAQGIQGVVPHEPEPLFLAARVFERRGRTVLAKALYEAAENCCNKLFDAAGAAAAKAAREKLED
jgi:serine/threonine protein kinase